MKNIYQIYKIAWLGLIALFFGAPHNSQAQDASFSQFYAAPLMLNPALSGNYTSIYLGANYRQKWRDKNSPLQQMQFAAIYPIKSKRSMKHSHIGSVGISVFDEKFGVKKSVSKTSVRLNASYNILFDNGNQKLTFGLNGGFVQRSIDLAKFKWGIQHDQYSGYDPSITPSLLSENVAGFNDRRASALFGAGIMWYFAPPVSRRSANITYHLGFSADNLNQPNVSFSDESEYKLPMLYKVNGGANITTASEIFKFSPNILFQSQNGKHQFNIGTYLNYYFSRSKFRKNFKSIVIGGWYRMNDAFIANIGFETDTYNIGLSYDSNTTYLDYNLSGGAALEISLSYKIKPKEKKRFSTPMM